MTVLELLDHLLVIPKLHYKNRNVKFWCKIVKTTQNKTKQNKKANKQNKTKRETWKPTYRTAEEDRFRLKLPMLLLNL